MPASVRSLTVAVRKNIRKNQPQPVFTPPRFKQGIYPGDLKHV